MPITKKLVVALVIAAQLAPAWAQSSLHQLNGGQQAGPSLIKPFVAPPTPQDFADEEDRLWDESKDAEKILRRRGVLVTQKEIASFLEDLTHKLYPEFKGVVRTHLVNDPGLNAFAFPNGGLYFNLGLVARMESVSQLACVVGHEGAHFVHRHGYQGRQNAKSAAAFGVGAAMFGVLGALGGLAAVSSVFGYSRELESEADRVGYQRLTRAGMNGADCVKVFELMASEAKAVDLKSPALFASHPKLTERIENFKLLTATPSANADAGLELWEKRFQTVVVPLRQLWLDTALTQSRSEILVYYLSRPETASLMPSMYRYYLAEAHRMRAKPGDIDTSIALHQENLERLKDFPESYRGLGSAYAAKGDKPAAISALQTYLKLSPQSQGAAFALQSLQQLQQ